MPSADHGPPTPSQPPTRTDDGEPRWQPASPRYIRARIVTALLVTPLPIAVGTYLAARYSPWWWLLVVPFALGLLNTLIFSRRYVTALGHQEREDEILVREGRLSRSTTLVPYGRLQHVSIAEGPIDSRLGLAKLSISTAASGTTDIPGLEVDRARALRARLVEASRYRDEGL